MTFRGSTPELVRTPNAPKRATLLELLFDVVFVAALALTSMMLAREVTWARAGQLALVLIALWWTWSITALLTDFYNPQRTPIQALITATMTGTIIMAATVPLAFTTQGWLFAGAYVAIHLGRGIGLTIALRGHHAQSRAIRFFFWFGVSGVLWIVGSLQDRPTQGVLWAFAAGIDLISASLRYPTPWLGRVPLNQYDQASSHLGERYQQFIILALGDLILVPTLRIGVTGFTGLRVFGFLLAFATTLLLWQLYVYQAATILESAISDRPGRATRWAAYTHLVMVAGIVATAAGFDVVLDEPLGDTPISSVAVIAGGPLLFLIGRVVFEYEARIELAWQRLIWVVVLIGVAPLLVMIPPVAVTAVVAAILLMTAASDAIRNRSARKPAPPPGT